MSLKRVRSSAAWVALALFASSAVVAEQAQNTQQPPIKNQNADKNNVDKYDEVHRGIFTPAPDRAREAGRFTEEMSKALAVSTAGGKLPRKNFVDEYIFGKMEKDGIPYTGLSSDEEFVRRAYLDATGVLPPSD